MEDMKLYIVLAVMVFMIVMFLWQKVSYGVTAMTSVTILAILGVINIQTAFSGITNKNTILVATMMVVGSGIGRTSLTRRMKDWLEKLKGKSGIMLMVAMFACTIVLCQVMGQVAVLTIMFVFVQSLDDKGDITKARMIFLIAVILSAWTGRFPVGMGAALPMQANAFYEGMAQEGQLLGMFDMTKVGLFPAILLTIYCLVAWKLIPSQEIDDSQMGQTGGGNKAAELSPVGEKVVFVIFAAVIFGFVASDFLGEIVYLIPVAGVLLMIYTKIMTKEEVVRVMTGDTVWMVAGMLAMSTALSSSGAGEAIGKLVLKILGSNPSGLMVLTVFCIATILMTTFMSNTGTMALLTPIAASTAIAGGMDPRAVVLVVNIASWFAIGFPTGCAAGTMAYAIGRHDPIKLLKFNIPYLIIAAVSLIFSVNIFFPVYG